MVHRPGARALVALGLLATAVVVPSGAAAAGSAQHADCISGEVLQAVPTDGPAWEAFENLSSDEQATFLRILHLSESRQASGLLETDARAEPGVWAARHIAYRNTTYEIVSLHVDCPSTRTPVFVTRVITRTVVVPRSPTASPTESPGQPGFTAAATGLAIVATLLLVRE